ncbi:K1324 protein, partial [Arenaria interpres]|nr:K1324 protein [Arenaria interpres]
TYSLGTGVRFDEWDEVPHGFANVATNLEVDEGFGDAVENCTARLPWWPLSPPTGQSSRWPPSHGSGRLSQGPPSPPAGRLSWWPLSPPVDRLSLWPLSPPAGWLSWWPPSPPTGQLSCWPPSPPAGRLPRWPLIPPAGWLPQGGPITSPPTLSTLPLPGVAYTSECFPCKPGTFAPAAGSSSCQLCPADTFSSKGATACQPCEPSTYAAPPPPPGQTQLMFKWAEPKICSEELPQAAQLPPSGVKTKCPPCNPGFAKSNGSACQPCPYGSYSNGSGCLSCPAGTEPVLGLEYKWWNVLPPNMETTVLSGINFEYKGMAGWEVAGDYIYTAAGASDNDFMILTLVVPGFSPPSPVLEDAESKEVARITFVFETICSVSCELYFMVGVNSRTNTPVETWTGPKGKQSYTYVVEKNATMSFTWAFQRTPYHEAGRRYTSDVAKLYSINVTNVLGGVASFCRRCVPEPAGSCAPCPPGNALDPTSGTCQPCPPGTYLRGHPSDGTPACHPCGPGTHSNQLRSLCYNNCSFSLALPGRVLRYDLSALATGTAFASGPSFTAKGLKYFHHFNISLCGHQGRKMASCSDNVTDARQPGGEGDPARVVRSHVCQSILVPPDLVGYKTPVSSQPVSLADRLLG